MELESPQLLPSLLGAAAVRSSPTPEAIRLPSTAGHAQQACAAAPADPAVYEYDRPVIGIVTHPGDGTCEMRTHGPGSYIAASYVKFVQSAGARVVPLLYDEPEERLLDVRASEAACHSAISLSLSSCLNMQLHCLLIPYWSLPLLISCRNWVW